VVAHYFSFIEIASISLIAKLPEKISPWESDGVVTLLRTYQSWYVALKNPHEGLRKPATGRPAGLYF
jgi:hypothetical protein